MALSYLAGNTRPSGPTKRSRRLVEDGQHVAVGTQPVQGAVDPKKVLRIIGPRATQKHEVQEVYRWQGVDITTGWHSRPW